MASRGAFTTAAFLLLLLHGSLVVGAPLNLMEILERGGQYNTFVGYLSITDAGRQMNDYVNGPNNLTVFAPTDSAFGSLEGGFFDRFSPREQMEFLLFHFVPQFFTWEKLMYAGNRVTSMAGGNYTLDFIVAGAQQVSIYTGLVTVPVGHQVNVTFPLAVYSVDTVLQHSQLFEAPASVPPASPSEPSAPPSVPPASPSEPSASPSVPPASPSEPSASPSVPPASPSTSPASPSEPPASTSASPPVPGRPMANDTVPPTSQTRTPGSEPQPSEDNGNASFQMKASWWFTLAVGVVSSWVVSL